VSVTLGWAVLCNTLLELLQAGAGVGAPWWTALRDRPGVFALGALVIWVVLMLVTAVTGRLWFPCALVLSATLGLGFADHMKLILRGEPLYPTDLDFAGSPGFLAHMLPTSQLVAIPLLLAAAASSVLLVGRLLAPRFPRVRRASSPRAWCALLVVRVVVVALCAAVLVQAHDFNRPHNLLRGAFDAAGASWMPWSPATNYLGNGFVGGTLYNMPVPAMTSPEGYSRSTMEEISRRYGAAADQHDRGRDPHALDDVNVVMVLSESFSDPMRLAGVSSAEDPIPFTRRLMRHTESGRLLAHKLGGGTADVEFEALTGMSVSQFAPQLSTPYQMLVPQYSHFPSAAEWFASHGHAAVGVHPFTTRLYRRAEVYPVLGFDELADQTLMHTRSRIEKGAFISDASAFAEVERRIGQSRRPMFLNLVTMQNHGPYHHQYSDPIRETGVSGDAASQAGDYQRGLRHSDDALRGFLGSLQASDEQTVVVFYGDHLPGFWPQRVREQNGDRRMRETPYFIWSNFGLEGARRTSTLSPMYLLPHALDRVGAVLPPYYVLLDRMSRALPGLEPGRYIDRNDQEVRRRDLSPSARRLLDDYRLVQYDLSVGHRYSERTMFGAS
jgi:phosphoglycerol transferase MdoB-like AlkP superfamily enzyme